MGTSSAPTDPQSQGSGLNINLGDKKPEFTVYEYILKEQSANIRKDIVEYLANKKYGTIKKTKKVRGADISEEIEYEGWYDVIQGKEALLDLQHALEVADFVSSFSGANIRGSNLDTQLSLFDMAMYIGLLAGQQIENPRFDFKGTDIDLAVAGVKIGGIVWGAFSAAAGGFTFRAIAENTTNVSILRQGEGGGGKYKPRGIVDKIVDGASKISGGY